MRHIRLLGAVMLFVSGLAGCARSPGGDGADGEKAVIVPRTLVPLTISGDRFVAQQSSFTASVATVDGAFVVRPAGASTAPEFRTSSIERGASRLDFGAAGIVSDGMGGVGVGRGPVLEQIQAVAQGLELSWTFPAAPDGSGDVLVRVGVTGAEVVRATSSSTVLRDTASGAQIRVGAALWIDAAGKKTAVGQSFADGVVTFRVPEALLLSSAYPAVLDPLVTSADLGPLKFAAELASGEINTLTVGVSGPGVVTSDDVSGGINCDTTGTDCSASYTKDMVVTLTAKPIDTGAPEKNYFVGWSGLCAGTSECKVPMSKKQFVYAYFEPAFWPLDIVKTGKGTGTITWNGHTCTSAEARCTFLVQNTRPVRQTADLSVVPDTGSSFTGWSADCGTATCSLYMDRPKHAYASFVRNAVTVKIEVDEVGTVSGPNGLCAAGRGASCPPGTTSSFTFTRDPSQQVVLTTDPSATFYSWGGDCRGSAISCTLTLDDDKTVYASWRGVHLATVGALGNVTVFAQANQDHGAGTSVQMACTNCHQANLLSQHNRHCEYCHSAGGPAEQLIDRWDGSCSAGSCHGSIHAASGDTHHNVYTPTGSCTVACHTETEGNPPPLSACTRCHDPSAVIAGDTTPPVTTSDAKDGDVFVGPHTIHLAATDTGSGVMVTFYWDSRGAGSWQIGTDPSAGFVPTSGPGIPYTLSFYSVDHAGNTEGVKSVSYIVKPKPVADTTPPTTTSTATNGATYTGNQTFTFSASDAGSGVASTWYKLDSAPAFTQGTSLSVSAPASGSVAHTISWYSTDLAGNVEATQAVSITVQAVVIDTTAPTTLSSFNPAPNAVFKTSQAVTLTPSDNVGGSGVKATYYKIDGAATFTQGTSFTISGDGLHTFSYYSVDNNNNTETTKVSNQFRIDTVAPVTTSTATNGASYTGNQTFTLSPSDAGSGVASTWYKLDAGAFTQGTSIAVAAPASSSASHTISWYSLDVAGNQEATKTVTFTVAAPVVVGTVTLVGSNSSQSSHPYTHFWVMDATDTTIIGDGGWSLDEHVTGASFVVPSGVGYVMHVEWEYPDYEGGATGSDFHVISSAEAAAGATVTWGLNLP